VELPTNEHELVSQKCCYWKQYNICSWTY